MPLPNETPELKKSYSFTILSLDTSDSGTFKQKSYKRNHLSEMYELFEDVKNVRKANEDNILMVGNGRLIKHTGDINSEEIKSLIGKAIQKKFLSMEDASGSKSLSQMGKKKGEGYTLTKGKEGHVEKSLLK
jgi:hypothetical protein